MLSLTARFAPSSQKGTRSQPLVSPQVGSGPSRSLPGRGASWFLSRDGLSSLVFRNHKQHWLPLFHVILAIFTKMPLIQLLSPSPGTSRDLRSLGPKSVQLETIAPSSQLRVLYCYFSPFMDTSLASSMISSSRASGVISFSWFAQSLYRVDTRRPRNRLRPRPGCWSDLSQARLYL